MSESEQTKQPTNGFIVLDRAILKHWIKDSPEKLGAWVDLLLMANWHDGVWNSGMSLEEIPRGTFISSQSKLAKRWGWSRWKTQCFFNLLEKEAMIRQQTGTRYTKITIVNYNKYQDVPKGQRREKGSGEAARRQRRGTTEQSNKNNNRDEDLINYKPPWGKRDIEGIKLYFDFVWLTETEYDKLEWKFGAAETLEKTKYLADLLMDDEKTLKTKKPYRSLKNHNRTLDNWLAKDQKKIHAELELRFANEEL